MISIEVPTEEEIREAKVSTEGACPGVPMEPLEFMGIPVIVVPGLPKGAFLVAPETLTQNAL